jgi:hypothetical protein
MDAAHLTQLLALAAGVFALVRFVLGTLDRAEAGFASLFVPPDRALGWPRGVQESDAPWGWRPPLDPLEAEGSDPIADIDPYGPRPAIVRQGSYVEPTRPVAPIHLRTLPQ